MFQHVDTGAVQHIEVRRIRKPLSPVTAAAADVRESLRSPQVHIKPFVQTAGIAVAAVEEVVKPGDLRRRTGQLIRDSVHAVGGVIGAVIIGDEIVIDDLIRLQIQQN